MRIVALILAATLGVLAQNPPGRGGPGRRGRTFDPATVDRGKALFSTNCGFCHGLDARGGDGGSDLGRSLVVMEDEDGAGVGNLLRSGRPDKGMPAFPGLTQNQIQEISTFLHERVEFARRSIASSANSILVGDVRAGEAYFNGAGRCSSCHSVAGDLKGIGSKYDPMTLQDKFVNPRGGGRGAPAPNTVKAVKVTRSSGQLISGKLLYISEFAVTLNDASGQRRSFARNGSEPKVEVDDPLQAHLDMMRKYTDKDMHDLTAYLVTLR